MNHVKILLYAGDRYLGGDKEQEEGLAFKALVQRYFYPSPRSPFVAWLFFHTKGGEGFALAIGGLSAKPGSRQKMHRKGIGIAPVPTQFQQTLLDFGPEGLRWDGTRIVANGN